MSLKASPAGADVVGVRRVAAAPLAQPVPLVGRLVRWCEREAPVIAAVGLFVGVVAAALPQAIVQDSWLTLVGGREIAEHGLPHVNLLTLWSYGAKWVDQQWLAQLFFYRLAALGGLKLVLIAHALGLTLAVIAAVVAARRFGGSSKSVAAVAVVSLFMAPWGLQMRAQSLAPLLFVAVVWLLVADAREPSRRVFWALPVLALWANVHGTVVLAAALVVLRGLLRLREPGRAVKAEGVALVLAAPLCCLASPYGFGLVGYYRSLLANPQMAAHVNEWAATTLSLTTALFFLGLAAVVALLARHRSSVTSFEALVLVVTGLAGLNAIRSIVWFSYACVIVCPRLLDRALPAWQQAPVRAATARATAAVGLAAVLIATGLVVSRPPSWFERAWPADALAAAQSAASDPHVKVFADDRYADWLLWKDPALRGRVAYDVRFELFTPSQFRQLIEYDAQTVGAARLDRGYTLFAFDPTTDGRAIATTLGRPGARRLFGDARLVLIETEGRA